MTRCGIDGCPSTDPAVAEMAHTGTALCEDCATEVASLGDSDVWQDCPLIVPRE